jgi:hypothetical protein
MHQRDDSFDQPPKEREPSDYYQKIVEEDESELAAAKAMSEKDILDAQQREIASLIAKNQEYILRKRLEYGRYSAMLGKVMMWPCPDEYKGLKEFMIKQLKESIDFDCYCFKMDVPSVVPAEEWKQAEIARLEKDVASAKESRDKHIESVTSANKWIAGLYKALEE